MSRTLMAGLATVALAIGTHSYGQDLPQSTTTQTTTVGADGIARTQSNTQRYVTGDGTQVTRQTTVQDSGAALTESSRVRVTEPDGTVRVIDHTPGRVVTTVTQPAPPPPAPVVTDQTTTTTTTTGR
ncbi:MAG TPA: hypothetical protein VKS60_19120 [Stellaceae bacterium]|nr:hypothetical protein [Stellaceae bacterium]